MSGRASVEELPTSTSPEEVENEVTGWMSAVSPVFSNVTSTSACWPGARAGMSARLAMSVGAGEGAGVGSGSGWGLLGRGLTMMPPCSPPEAPGCSLMMGTSPSARALWVPAESSAEAHEMASTVPARAAAS